MHADVDLQGHWQPSAWMKLLRLEQLELGLLQRDSQELLKLSSEHCSSSWAFSAEPEGFSSAAAGACG